jgi:putative ABC transport system ATP-binding protein
MDAMNTPLISLRSVSKVFEGDELESHALNGVHLDVHRGEYLSISGPSGAGKTTLLSILGLLDTPSSGEYLFQGRAMKGLSSRERARLRNLEIGFVFQSFNLITDLSVAENVELPLRYRGMPVVEARRRAGEALERVGMAHRARHSPSQLSGGQQQRVAVARAVAGRPGLLLADEPTGNLDSANSDAVMGILEDLHADGATICMVTHEPRHARRAERVVELFDGRIVSESRGALVG